MELRATRRSVDAMAPQAPTVLIADPGPMTRAGLRAWLGATARTVDASDLTGALRASTDPAVDVAVVDARLAGLGTAEAREGLRALARRVPVVVMGMTGDPDPYTVAVVAAGGAGYWRKDDDVDELVKLLRATLDTARAEPTASPAG
jgi:DNA-binding NarL/FixJ family response regulator